MLGVMVAVGGPENGHKAVNKVQPTSQGNIMGWGETQVYKVWKPWVGKGRKFSQNMVRRTSHNWEGRRTIVYAKGRQARVHRNGRWQAGPT